MRRVQNSVYSWPAIERMMQIHRLIQNREYPNCSKIAHDFEMSVRTIKRDVELKTFQLLTRAVSERRKVNFLYRNRGEVKAQRRQRVHPFHIACVENQWCMFGFDPKRNDVRTFVLARLSKPALAGGRFEVP